MKTLSIFISVFIWVWVGFFISVPLGHSRPQTRGQTVHAKPSNPKCQMPELTPTSHEVIPPPPRMNEAPQLIHNLTLTTTRDHLNGGSSCTKPTDAPNQVVPSFCNRCECLFSNIQAVARSGPGDCQIRPQAHYKNYSPWATLDRFDRYKLALSLAQRHAATYDQQSDGNVRAGLPSTWKKIKPAMMACLAAKETGGTFEPMIIGHGNCAGVSNYAGMGQQSQSDFVDSVTKGQSIYGEQIKFRSALPRYQHDTTKEKMGQTYGMLTADPELQFEFMDYFLTSKLSDMKEKLGRLPSDYDLVENLGAWYNGSDSKASYGLAVRACTHCTVTLLNKGLYSPDDANNCIGYANYSVCGEVMAANPGKKFGCSVRGQRPDRAPGRKR